MVFVARDKGIYDSAQLAAQEDRDDSRRCLVCTQAMIVASPTLGAADLPDLIRSKLYDPTFGHRFRKASAGTETSPENAA